MQNLLKTAVVRREVLTAKPAICNNDRQYVVQLTLSVLLVLTAMRFNGVCWQNRLCIVGMVLFFSLLL